MILLQRFSEDLKFHCVRLKVGLSSGVEQFPVFPGRRTIVVCMGMRGGYGSKERGEEERRR